MRGMMIASLIAASPSAPRDAAAATLDEQPLVHVDVPELEPDTSPGVSLEDARRVDAEVAELSRHVEQAAERHVSDRTDEDPAGHVDVELEPRIERPRHYARRFTTTVKPVTRSRKTAGPTEAEWAVIEAAGAADDG